MTVVQLVSVIVAGNALLFVKIAAGKILADTDFPGRI